MKATATFTLDVTYDDRHTDPESLATALDQFLETALSASDIRDDYGPVEVAEFLPISVVSGKQRSVYRYRYARPDDTPLRRCPHCDAELTVPGGIDLVLSVGGKVLTVPSRLDPAGYLEDTEDEAVAAGYHSATDCRACGESLIEWEDQIRVPRWEKLR